jgi:hypothetical protein
MTVFLIEFVWDGWSTTLFVAYAGQQIGVE